MKPNTHLITLALEGKAPTNLRIFPAGAFTTTKGTFNFTPKSAALVMQEHRMYGNRRSVDYEHQALAEPPVEAPAAGWYDLEARNTPEGPELWATNLEWTERARARIDAKEYLYTSPAFLHDDERQVVGFVNFALTNLPATHGLPALIAAKMDPHRTRWERLTNVQRHNLAVTDPKAFQKVYDEYRQPKRPGGHGGKLRTGELTWKGKAFDELSNMERHTLAHTDRALFNRMRRSAAARRSVRREARS